MHNDLAKQVAPKVTEGGWREAAAPRLKETLNNLATMALFDLDSGRRSDGPAEFRVARLCGQEEVHEARCVFS
jgi:hypothetical protein